MNCQEFRSRWLDETDSDQLAHMETCEACIAWMESQTLGDEEVQFLKEIPSPPANLEDRIMQAIYQTAGQVTPPHAAAAALPPKADTASKRRMASVPFAWVSAAAVLLVVGIFGYQQLQGPGVQTAQESSGAPQSDQTGGANTLLTFEHEPAASESGSESSDQTQQGEIGASAADTAETPSEEPAPNENSAASSEPAAPVQEEANPAAALQKETTEMPAEEAVPPNREPAPREDRPMIASRSTDGPSAAQSKQTETANEASQPADAPDEQPAPNVAAAVIPEQSVFALTSAPEAEMKAAASAAQEADENAVVGPPAPSEKSAITLSTFQDVETAVQSSNMPVPVLNQLPESFVLSGISVRYESETSQNVESLFSNYVRGQDWIRVDVERNKDGKRSLSIPGTFTATHLFSINNEQAIGVTYEKQQSDQPYAAQHAVHFNAQSGDQSLYVVITAYGVSLEELMETSKLISWKP